MLTGKPIRVVVTGGRDCRNARLLYKTLDAMNLTSPIVFLGHGGARGADTLAGEWAHSRNVPAQVWKADWDTHGRAAGHIRNAVMLKEAEPDLLVAFHGGVGTENCVAKAIKAGIKVLRVAMFELELLNKIARPSGFEPWKVYEDNEISTRKRAELCVNEVVVKYLLATKSLVAEDGTGDGLPLPDGFSGALFYLQSGWLPIETAPKSGDTWVDLRVRDRIVVNAFWEFGLECWMAYDNDDPALWNQMQHDVQAVTHWRPRE